MKKSIMPILTLLALLIGCSTGCLTGMQLTNPPNSVIINSEYWNIHILDASQYYWDGMTNCKQKTIFLDKSLSGFDMRRVLYHELLHANLCSKAYNKDTGEIDNTYYNVTDFSSDSDDHGKGFNRISDFTIDLMANNPELFAYLTKTSITKE